MELSHLEPLTADAIFSGLSSAIVQAIREKDPEAIKSIFKIISKYRPSKDPRKPSQEMVALNRLRSQGYITKLYQMRDSLNRGRRRMYEMSGYIPSESEKNDPRWKMALTKDVRPGTMKQSAKKFGWKIKRDGTPPTMR